MAIMRRFIQLLREWAISCAREIMARATRVLRIEISHYDRGGLYCQSIVLIVCWGFWELWPAFSGRPIEPGFAIGALGLVAVIMTVRGEHLTKAEKVIWVIIGVVLLVVEIHVIDQDRINQYNDHWAELQQRETEFTKTMDEFSKANKGENQHFGQLLDEQSSIFKGMQKNTREVEDALTGGDSYVTVIPTFVSDPNTADLLVHVTGKNTMYDVTIEMQDGKIDGQYFAAHIKEYLAGTLRKAYRFPSVSTTYAQPLGAVIHPDVNKVNEYNFWVFSRTRLSHETLQVKLDRIKNRWVSSYEIFMDGETKPIFVTDFDGKITKRRK